jgi:small subunit ribosomal protein S16
MPVKIRLARCGAKKKPFYRLVAADSQSRRDGKFIEVLGTYNPLTEPATLSLKKERIAYWLDKGAIPTDTVRSFIKKEGIATTV